MGLHPAPRKCAKRFHESTCRHPHNGKRLTVLRSASSSTRMVWRERVLNVRMTDLEMAMVRDLAERSGLSQSDTVRQLIRAAHAQLPAKPATKKRKPK